MADLPRELGRMNFGADLADALASIGRSLGESKRREFVDQQVKDAFSMLDLSRPESVLSPQFMSKIQSISHIPEGQEALQSMNVGTGMFNMFEQAAQRRDQMKRENLKMRSDPYQKGLAQYQIDLRTPNIDSKNLEGAYRNLVSQRQSLLPEFRGYEDMLGEPPPPQALRGEETIGTTVVGKDGKYYTLIKKANGSTVWRPGIEAPEIKLTGAGGAMSKGIDALKNADWTKHGQEFLDSISDPAIRNDIEGIGKYMIDPAKSTSMFRSAERATYIAAARQYEPTWDMTQYPAREALRKSATSGALSKNIRSINTVVGHLQSLNKYGNELENADLRVWNAIKNEGLNAVGDPRVKNFLSAATAVENELATVFKGTGATDQEIKQWRAAISSSDSPEQIRNAISTAVHLMSSRLTAISDQWQQGMGTPKDFRILSPESRLILHNLGIDPDTVDPPSDRPQQSDQPQQPQQQTTQDQYEVGQTYQDAQGNKAKYKGNGQWEEIP